MCLLHCLDLLPYPAHGTEQVKGEPDGYGGVMNDRPGGDLPRRSNDCVDYVS
jgi:hypothetical protein